MNNFICRGLHWESCHVPPFQVASNQLVKVIFPSELAEEMGRVKNALCDSQCQEVTAKGNVIAVQPWFRRSRLREIIHRQTAAECLTFRTEISLGQARCLLQNVRVNPDLPMCQLAANPLWMIGFLAAIHDEPATVVFDTAGLDPRGVQTALETAKRRLGHAAGIYLTCFPELRGVEEPEYSRVLEVVTGQPAQVA